MRSSRKQREGKSVADIFRGNLQKIRSICFDDDAGCM